MNTRLATLPSHGYQDEGDYSYRVTRNQAINEYRLHGWTVAELINDLGDRPDYRACDVMHALGY